MLFEGLIVLLAVAGSALLTRAMIVYAKHRCLVDVPNERSSHVQPTPRGGGLAFVVVFLVGVFILYGRGLLLPSECLAFAGSAIIAAAVGFWDDHGHVTAYNRVFAHFIAAGWALYWLGGLPSVAGSMTVWIGIQNVFWLVALVWLLNVFNFMDGIDGIAGAEVVFISGAAGILFLFSGANTQAILCFLLLAVIVGFLFWNLPPARIFMGDVGSGFLGIVLGVLAIVSAKQGVLNMWVWTIFLGVFIVDATITIASRMIRGEKWYSAHRSHAYQHAVRKLGSHGRVTAIVTGINVIWLSPLACAAWRWPHLGVVFVLIAYFPLIVLALRLQAGMDRSI